MGRHREHGATIVGRFLLLAVAILAATALLMAQARGWKWRPVTVHSVSAQPSANRRSLSRAGDLSFRRDFRHPGQRHPPTATARIPPRRLRRPPVER